MRESEVVRFFNPTTLQVEIVQYKHIDNGERGKSWSKDVASGKTNCPWKNYWWSTFRKSTLLTEDFVFFRCHVNPQAVPIAINRGRYSLKEQESIQRKSGSGW